MATSVSTQPVASRSSFLMNGRHRPMHSKNLYGLFDATPEPEDTLVKPAFVDASEVLANVVIDHNNDVRVHVKDEDQETKPLQPDEAIANPLPPTVDISGLRTEPEDVKAEDTALDTFRPLKYVPPDEAHDFPEQPAPENGSPQVEDNRPVTLIKREGSYSVGTTPVQVTPSDSAPSRPKRARMVVEVVVPTPESLYGRRQPLLPAQEATVHGLRNPSFSVKIKQEYQLSSDSVYDRIAKIGKDPYPGVPDDPIFTSLVAPREFYSKLFGGSCQNTFPTISKRNFERHGYDDFMYTMLDWEPHAPQIAGAPGLWYESDLNPGQQHGEWKQVQRVIVRMAPSRWLYVGQYEMTPAEPLTAREWQQQQPIVRNTWVKSVLSESWQRIIRCRITLRKQLGREPEPQEIKDVWETDNDCKGITAEDVSSAFARGEERINIWYMKCVGYDEAFQREVIDNFSTWVPPPRVERGQGNRAKKKARLAAEAVAAPVRRRKRKRDNDPESSEDETENAPPFVEDADNTTVEQMGDLRRSKRVRRPPRPLDMDSDIEDIVVETKGDPEVINID